jgi:signal recognition particle subunit SRP54
LLEFLHKIAVALLFLHKNVCCGQKTINIIFLKTKYKKMMFDKLTENLAKVFDKLTSSGYLRESDIEVALREIRVALLEADVALPVVKDLAKIIKDEALGEKVIASIAPGQMVVKIVQDAIEKLLTANNQELNLSVAPPAVILMAGLQGGGKTTSAGKLALKLKKDGKKVLLASTDIYRPAAQKQLEILAKQNGIDALEIIEGQKPLDITKRAISSGKYYDVIIIDTAGRQHVNQDLMTELKEIKKLAKPVETLLVADAITGQDAVNIAQAFNHAIGISGIILTRVDSDARGGAALSMAYITKCPIKFLGTGEKVEDFIVFVPDRIASRILGMGDIVSLVEKAQGLTDKETSEKLMRQVEKGQFNLNMFADQLKNINKMGGFAGVIKMIPGINKLLGNVEREGMSESVVKKQLAIISSMTKEERKYPKTLNASRKIRIANGSGTKVHEINKLIKNFLEMQKMFKKFGKIDKEALLSGKLKGFF